MASSEGPGAERLTLDASATEVIGRPPPGCGVSRGRPRVVTDVRPRRRADHGGAIRRRARPEAPMLQIFTSPLPALGVGGILAPDDWPAFLDAVSGELAGSPVIVDVTSSNRPRAVVARGVLQVLLYDPRSDVIEVAVRTPTPDRISV